MKERPLSGRKREVIHVPILCADARLESTRGTETRERCRRRQRQDSRSRPRARLYSASERSAKAHCSAERPASAWHASKLVSEDRINGSMLRPEPKARIRALRAPPKGAQITVAPSPSRSLRQSQRPARPEPLLQARGHWTEFPTCHLHETSDGEGLQLPDLARPSHAHEPGPWHD